MGVVADVPSEEVVLWKEGIGGRSPAVRGGAACCVENAMLRVSVAVMGRSNAVSIDSGCVWELRLCEENLEDRFRAEMDSLLPLDLGAGIT